MRVFDPQACPSDRQQADFNSKPTGGSQLQKSVLHVVGARFYPPCGSEHYKLLELDKYSIGIHRGSFRHQANSPHVAETDSQN